MKAIKSSFMNRGGNKDEPSSSRITDSLSTPYQSYTEGNGNPPEGGPSLPLPSAENSNLNENKNSVPSTTIANNPTSEARRYKGFTTSITHSFQHNTPHTRNKRKEFDRIDCCSIACCGILQSDYDRYLLTGVKPPSIFKRITVHFLLPVVIFVFAVYCAMFIPNMYFNQLICTVVILLLLCYLIMQCCFKGREKRIYVRKELLKKLYQIERAGRSSRRGFQRARIAEEGDEGANDTGNDDHYDTDTDDDDDDDSSGVPESTYLSGQSRWDLNCAHLVCGCYNTDIPTLVEQDEEHSVLIDGPDMTENKKDLCSFMWSCFTSTFCGKLCGTYLQCFGMCGLAQEGREVEILLPKTIRLIDYITMEPYISYYRSILQLRLDKNGNLFQHYLSLSRLSNKILKYFLFLLITLFVMSMLPRQFIRFRTSNFILLLLVFVETFILLFIIHWFRHKHDISLDAVIKYFTCGFVLSTSLAIFFELVSGLAIRAIMSIIMAIFGISIGYNAGGYTSTSNHDGYAHDTTASSATAVEGQHLYTQEFNTGTMFKHSFTTSVHEQEGAIDFHMYGNGLFNKDYLESFGRDHPFIYVFYLLISTYVIAALVEELCKYYGYRMVDHPDFCTSKELNDTEKIMSSPLSPSHHYSTTSSFMNIFRRAVTTTDNNSSNAASTDDNRPQSPSIVQSVSQTVQDVIEELPAIVTTDAQQQNNGENSPPRDFNGQDSNFSYVSKASAITIAMVSVALGFACCENLIYIFLYNGTSMEVEISVFIVRSLFPIHPIAAAIQSLGVVQRDVIEEVVGIDNSDGNNNSNNNTKKITKLGRNIILPAVMLHGTFDFFLVLINFIATMGIEEAEENIQKETTTAIVSFVVSVICVVGGLIFYFYKSKEQREQLTRMDEQFSNSSTTTGRNNRVNASTTFVDLEQSYRQII